MEKSTSNRQHEQEQALEEAYRRGYHHGLARTRELLLRLLNEGMPPFVALELCRVFVIWRKFCQEFAMIPAYHPTSSASHLSQRTFSCEAAHEPTGR
jgi:hypothetical protein